MTHSKIRKSGFRYRHYLCACGYSFPSYEIPECVFSKLKAQTIQFQSALDQILAQE